jgi:hydroxyacylglutathione hydrolase
VSSHFLILMFLLAATSLRSQVQTGSLPLTWTPGTGNCLEEPDWQVHEYNEDFYVLRQSGCTHYEKPFLYLIFGEGKALLLDTGAGSPNTAAFVSGLMAKRGRADWELIVAHSHGHRDHTAGDVGFAAMPKAKVIAPKVEELKAALGIANWPVDAGSLDLGGRVVDAIPIPGHDDVSVAFYDRKTGVLLTGDSMYPGRLYVSKWKEFSESVHRLVEFTRTRPVAHVLGTHVEQTRTPFRDYPTGTTFQPGEHVLALSRVTCWSWTQCCRKRRILRLV